MPGKNKKNGNVIKTRKKNRPQLTARKRRRTRSSDKGLVDVKKFKQVRVLLERSKIVEEMVREKYEVLQDDLNKPEIRFGKGKFKILQENLNKPEVGYGKEKYDILQQSFNNPAVGYGKEKYEILPANVNKPEVRFRKEKCDILPANVNKPEVGFRKEKCDILPANVNKPEVGFGKEKCDILQANVNKSKVGFRKEKCDILQANVNKPEVGFGKEKCEILQANVNKPEVGFGKEMNIPSIKIIVGGGSKRVIVEKKDKKKRRKPWNLKDSEIPSNLVRVTSANKLFSNAQLGDPCVHQTFSIVKLNDPIAKCPLISEPASTPVVLNFKTPVVLNFKTPLPVKRPPSRLPNSPTPKKKNSEDADDVISLFAETIYDFPAGKSETEQEKVIEKASSEEICSEPKEPISSEGISEKVPEENEISIPNKSMVTDWIETAEKPISNQINYSLLLRGYCYRYLHSGVCKFKSCRFRHNIPSVDFPTLSESEFQTVYNLSVRYNFLYETWFDSIIGYLSDHGRNDLIVNLICDVIKLPDDKTPFVKKIVKALRNMGSSFEEAINDILLMTSRKNECLVGILLSLAVEEELLTNWNVIAKLTNFRKHDLDYNVMREIFKKCIDHDPPNKLLCENIYKDIIVKNSCNLRRIDRKIIIKYLAQLYQSDLKSCAEYIMHNYQIDALELPIEAPTLTFSSSSSSSSSDDSKKSYNQSVLMDVDEESPPILTEPYGPDCFDLVKSNDSGNSTHKYNPNAPSLNIPPGVPITCVSQTSSSIHEDSPQGNDIPDSDIIRLGLSLKTRDSSQLLGLICKYMESRTGLRNLIVHLLAALRRPEEDFFEVVSQMFRIFGDYCQNSNEQMNALRLIGFNLACELDHEGKYETLRNILGIFSKNYLAFVKYDCVIRKIKHVSTQELKYVFLFKILWKCGNIDEAVKLLKNPEVNLIQIIFKDDDRTIAGINNYKVEILSEFVKTIFCEHFTEAKTVIVYLMLNVNIEKWSEMKVFINMLITRMLAAYNTYQIDVLSLLENVLSCWYRYLKYSVLRVLLIQVYKHVSKEKILELFHLCLHQDVYPSHQGNENSILIPSDLLPEEIHLLLRHHFLKICESRFPFESIVVTVADAAARDEYHRLHPLLAPDAARPPRNAVYRLLNVLSRMGYSSAGVEANPRAPEDRYVEVPCSSAVLEPYRAAARGERAAPAPLKFG